MANIMMTDVCNLACPYCFANEFVNKDKNEITEEAFDEAVNFIVGDKTHATVGLIGGEPTIHSRFDYFLRKLIKDERVKSVVVYTNGIQIDKYWDIITHPKVHLLINCNSPEDIGNASYEKLCSNLDILLDKKAFTDNVTLGINMYKPDFEYRYILELLKKYGFDRVRVSITVPNMEGERNHDAHSYFTRIKPRLFEFFDELLSEGIVPNFDCNKIPSCLIKDEELKVFDKYRANEKLMEKMKASNIMHSKVQCSPVIDIRQDLTAVRCFGLSEISKQSIKDFNGIRELEAFYIRTIDAYAYNTAYSAECIDCHKRMTMDCSGGCLAFKINSIMELQQIADKKLNELK